MCVVSNGVCMHAIRTSLALLDKMAMGIKINRVVMITIRINRVVMIHTSIIQTPHEVASGVSSIPARTTLRRIIIHV